MTVPEFITKAFYDPMGQMILACQAKGQQILLDVCSWGAIQVVISDVVEAEKFQDELGQWVTDAINEKIEREKSVQV